MDIIRWNGLLQDIMTWRGSKKKLALAAVAAALGSIYTIDYTKKFFFKTLFAGDSNDRKTKSWFQNLFISKSSNDSKVSSSLLSKSQIDSILRKYEYTWKRGNDEGPVAWFETNHIQANNPIEDRHSECYLQLNKAFFFGVYDGHSGWYCSETLRKRLPTYVSVALMPPDCRDDWIKGNIATGAIRYLSSSSEDCPTFEFPEDFHDKQRRIKTGDAVFADKIGKDLQLESSESLRLAYLHMDNDISKEAVPDGIFNESLLAGISGAVAVGAYVKGNEILVGSTGDCRAVLGSRSKNGKWLHVALSEDHTAQNSGEVERLNREHPNETKTLLFGNRLLGQLMPLRSFGDVQYKWSKELHNRVLKVIYGRTPVPESIYKTPPYLTAEPEVTSKTLVSNDKFLILGTDGLWDNVSSESAVEIVGRYLDELDKGELPEENSATQLIRQSLGKGSDYTLSKMLQLPNRLKRNFHDDITVTVVFFNVIDEQKTKL